LGFFAYPDSIKPVMRNYLVYKDFDALSLEGFSFKDEIAECIAEFDRQKFEEYKGIKDNIIMRPDKREFEGFSSKEDLLRYGIYLKFDPHMKDNLPICKHILKASRKFGASKYLSFLENIERCESLPLSIFELTAKEREELEKEEEEEQKEKEELEKRQLEETLAEFNMISEPSVLVLDLFCSNEPSF
jgi:hypothetical protein